MKQILPHLLAKEYHAETGYRVLEYIRTMLIIEFRSKQKDTGELRSNLVFSMVAREGQ